MEQAQVIINGTDISEHIIAGSYNVVSKDSYESWNDANMVEHRIIIAKKVSGSFEVACSNLDRSITLSDFLTLWNSVVNNGVVTLSVWVLNQNELQALDCYYEITSKQHELKPDGTFVDILQISIKQR